MFTRAAKELLRNTISSVDHHNRVLEEQEMWRQWELEKGLTMMVSDEALRARQHSQRSLKQGSKRRHSPESSLPAAGSSSSQERWGHSGYRELYPEEFSPPREKRQRRSSNHRRNGKPHHRHRKSRHKKSSGQEGRRSRSRHRHRCRDSSTSSSSSSDSSTNSSDSSTNSSESSDTELVWEERKT
ncbi:uncharacterized protein NKAPD1 [Rhipicephalus sanguineus]|uniref:Uncharacterized protein n=1 Tax=Rhipicephalus sanguineus TaxID=34632 RepID=A0A9D4SX04_RHISA|nr:uncharacterized protein NKAPD1 [Rhipicephalus sanguineus]KAH7952521.1 hypothetical protein HPB52_023856 [Rhipicephalus sanguineus]